MPGPVCIIPARGGSKRLPRKNVAELGGKPLLSWAIESAVDSGVFDLVCVSSEDEEILTLARERADVRAVERPPELATDDVPVKVVCARLLEDLAREGRTFEEFGILLVTNPFRTGADVEAAYRAFREADADYLMSLVPFSHPPQRAVWIPDGRVEPYFGMEHMKRTQLLDPLYRHDGSIVFARTEVFLAEGEIYGSDVIPFFMSPERSVDIDSPLDLEWAEFLLRRSELGARED